MDKKGHYSNRGGWGLKKGKRKDMQNRKLQKKRESAGWGRIENCTRVSVQWKGRRWIRKGVTAIGGNGG